MTLNEADTRVRLIDPKVHDSGWKEGRSIDSFSMKKIIFTCS